MLKVVLLFRYLNQGRRNQIDIGGGGGGGMGGGVATVCTPRQFQNLEPPKYNFQRFGKLYLIYRKAYYRLKVWERVDQD